jgi:hypothetical protein
MERFDRSVQVTEKVVTMHVDGVVMLISLWG